MNQESHRLQAWECQLFKDTESIYFIALRESL